MSETEEVFTVQVVGGAPKVLKYSDFSTIAEVKAEMNAEKYTATMNGDPVEDDDDVEVYSFISLAPSVKGA